jgi:hypothetical protein
LGAAVGLRVRRPTEVPRYNALYAIAETAFS